MAKFFRGLGDPTRLRILTLLAKREYSVSELVSELGSLQGRVSSHLACLRWCGMVESRRQGRSSYYRLADRRIRQLLDLSIDFVGDQSQQIELCRIIDQDGERPAP
jgi:ArsR family transcriptional regulator, cadmium/lead-responsive transcriptional repressor